MILGNQPAVLLTDIGACPLILHPGLDEIYRIDSGGTTSTGYRAQGKPIGVNNSYCID